MYNPANVLWEVTALTTAQNLFGATCWFPHFKHLQRKFLSRWVKTIFAQWGAEGQGCNSPALPLLRGASEWQTSLLQEQEGWMDARSSCVQLLSTLCCHFRRSTCHQLCRICSHFCLIRRDNEFRAASTVRSRQHSTPGNVPLWHKNMYNRITAHRVVPSEESLLFLFGHKNDWWMSSSTVSRRDNEYVLLHSVCAFDWCEIFWKTIQLCMKRLVHTKAS